MNLVEFSRHLEEVQSVTWTYDRDADEAVFTGLSEILLAKLGTVQIRVSKATIQAISTKAELKTALYNALKTAYKNAIDEKLGT